MVEQLRNDQPLQIPYAPRGGQPNIPIQSIQSGHVPVIAQAPNHSGQLVPAPSLHSQMTQLYNDITTGLDFIDGSVNAGTIVVGDDQYNEWARLTGIAMDNYEHRFMQPYVRGRPPVNGNGIGRRIRGRGLQVDHSIGVKPAIKFAPFGKYLLDMSKLKDDTIAMKTMSGTSVVGHPSKKVSSQFSKIVKDMIGGKVPCDEDLSGLSTLEREYLHKVSKKANIEDKFAVATPSKDQYEKDIHSFEVMRGEIVAGNDNQEMIKKFKLLIMKLSRSGSLPKNEVSEILSELAELGY